MQSLVLCLSGKDTLKWRLTLEQVAYSATKAYGLIVFVSL